MISQKQVIILFFICICVSLGNDSFWIGVPRPYLIAHRGSRTLNPENTLLAFQTALEFGADVLEFDVRLTKDDELIIFHDAYLNRSTNANALVRDYTLHQIKQLDAAYWYDPENTNEYPLRSKGVSIPTLSEYMNKFYSSKDVNQKIYTNIEIKDNDKRAVDKIVEIFKQYPKEIIRDRFLIVSTFCPIIDYFRELTKEYEWKTGACEMECIELVIPNKLGLHKLYNLFRPINKPDAFQLPVISSAFNLLTKSLINHVHSLHKEINYWVVNDPIVIEQIAKNGADGLITDRIDLAYDTFIKLGLRKPKPKPKIEYFIPSSNPHEGYTCVKSKFVCVIVEQFHIIAPLFLLFLVIGIALLCIQYCFSSHKPKSE